MFAGIGALEALTMEFWNLEKGRGRRGSPACRIFHLFVQRLPSYAQSGQMNEYSYMHTYPVPHQVMPMRMIKCH